ncbi:unnamed protein product [Lupinus luteus]|uniref:Uncharacterized protein n=1 Tax=Lupinus luteus TaxID=3873 RepID=A0AAV1X0V2_LUPLU
MVEEMEVYIKGKFHSRRVSSEEFDNFPRKHEGIHQTTYREMSASPGSRHVNPFTIKKRKVIPNLVQFSRERNNIGTT